MLVFFSCVSILLDVSHARVVYGDCAMSERIDHRLGGRSFPDADRLREQLQMSLDVLNGLQDNRDQSDRYGNAYDSFVDDSQWEESPERERAIDDAPRGPQIPRPSDWGASPAVDLPIDSD